MKLLCLIFQFGFNSGLNTSFCKNKMLSLSCNRNKFFFFFFFPGLIFGVHEESMG